MEGCKRARQRSGSKYSLFSPFLFIRWQVLSLVWSLVKFGLFLIFLYMLAYFDFEFWQHLTGGSDGNNPEHGDKIVKRNELMNAAEQNQYELDAEGFQAMHLNARNQEDESNELVQADGRPLSNPPYSRNLLVPADDSNHGIATYESNVSVPAERSIQPVSWDSNQPAPIRGNFLQESTSTVSNELKKDKTLIRRTICEQYVVKEPGHNDQSRALKSPHMAERSSSTDDFNPHHDEPTESSDEQESRSEEEPSTNDDLSPSIQDLEVERTLSGISSDNRSSVGTLRLSPSPSNISEPSEDKKRMHHSDSESSDVRHEVSLRSFIAKEQHRPYKDLK